MADYSLGTAHGQIKIDADTSGVDQTEQALGRVNKSAQTTEQAMDKTARTTGIAGAAIAGGLGLAVKTAMDFDFQLSAIQSVSGATATEMDKIRDAALRIGTDTKFSATEAAGAMEELAKAGVSTDDILGGVADATVALAAATGTDMANAATIASDTMNMFGLKAQDMDGIVNTLAQTANASSIGIDDLGMAFSQVGAVANLVGMDVNETASAIGQLGDAGIKGSDAGTSLKTMLMNLQPTTKAQTTAMRDLGLITEDGTNQFFNANGELKSLREVQEILHNSTKDLTDAQKQQALETIFGTDAIRAAAVMAENGAAGFDAFAKKQSETGTAAEQAKIRQDNLKGSLEQLKGSLETAAITIGSALTPMIRFLADALGGLVGWFNSLSPTTQQWIVGILAAAAGLLLLTAGVLKGIMMFRSMIQTMQTLRILSTATQTGFIKTAATWVASAIKMVAHAILWAAQMAMQAAVVVAKWAWMAAQAVAHGIAVAAAWTASALKVVAQWVWMGIQAALHAAKVAASWLLAHGTAAAAAVAGTVATVTKILAQWALMGVQAALHAAKVAAAWLITHGVAAATALASMAVTAAAMVAHWVAMAAGAMARAVIMAAAWFVALGPVGWVIAIIVGLVALIIANWDTVVEWTKAAWDKVVSWVKQAWEWIKEAVSAAAKFILDLFLNWTLPGLIIQHWDTIVNAIKGAWEWIKNVVSSGLSWISGILSAGWNAITGAVSGAWNAIVGAVSSGINNVMSFVGSLPGRILGALGNLGSLLLGAGGDLIRGLWNGISGMFNWVMGKIRGFAGSIVSGIKNFFGIGSPSKLFADDIGHWLPAGLAIGIDANADAALKAAEALGKGVTSSVSMSPGGSEAFWDGTALGSGYVPPSNEVESYAASQGAGGASGGANITTIINNPVAEKASDSEARRLRALSALGAF